MITISDIAVLAETSTATVSPRPNADPHVAPGTRQRILQVIATTGYKPRSSSKTDSKKKTVFLFCSPSLENPYFSTILERRGASRQRRRL